MISLRKSNKRAHAHCRIHIRMQQTFPQLDDADADNNFSNKYFHTIMNIIVH